MNLTRAQRDAVNHCDNALIIACPGSGKTRALVGKLLHSLEEVKGTTRKIACLTYTNAAVYEIEDRLRKYGSAADDEHCDVATIHSFCLVNILNNFYWHIPEYSDVFSVATPECEDFQRVAKDVLAEYGLPQQMSEHFESLNRDVDGTPIVSPDLGPDVAIAFWEGLRKRGLIDFPNIIYYSYRLLKEKPSIAYALSCKYAWFLVDEFQDTTTLQVEIFRSIAVYEHTKFFLVGDPYQSIYGFAGARVEMMEVFASEIAAKCDFTLLDNYRSSNPIIKHAEELCPRSPKMRGVGECSQEAIDPVYVHASSAFDAITDYFIPTINDMGISYGKAAILAPWWIKLLHLGRNLRDYGIPIVGPGARPYKKSHLFSTLAEQLCAYHTHPTPKSFHQIEKELFLLVAAITGRRNYLIYSYYGNVTIRKLISVSGEIYTKCSRAVDWLLAASVEVEAILIRDGLMSADSVNLLTESAANIIKDLKKNKIDVGNLSADDLGLFASTDKNLHLLTMHKAKGREFDAVAIIDLHEERVPDFRAIKNGDMAQIEENKRLLYVSITRARRFLMYVTDDEDHRNRPSRFLKQGHLNLIKHS